MADHLSKNTQLPTIFAVGLLFLLITNSANAQDLDPRSYLRLPTRTTTLITGISYSRGGVVTDPTLPFTNVKADVLAGTAGVLQSFNFFGLSSSVLAVIPYSWAQASGDVGEQRSSVTRTGLADMRLRWSVLLLGGKAATIAELRNAPRKTILGFSVNIIAPTGEFFPDKLVNLGTNRWSFRPELAISQPISKRWLLDAYAGVWLFTDNKTFYPGNAIRQQDPMGAFQMHVSYNIKPTLWVAFNSTFYTGGQSTINSTVKDDRQSNVRLGLTAVVPTGKMSSLKLAVSKGAVIRIGQDFTTFNLGWQRTWIGGMKKK
jgi:hypothetical protein